MILGICKLLKTLLIRKVWNIKGAKLLCCGHTAVDRESQRLDTRYVDSLQYVLTSPEASAVPYVRYLCTSTSASVVDSRRTLQLVQTRVASLSILFSQ